MSASISIHNVVGIAIERERTDNGSKWFELVITDDKGVQTELTLFFKKPPVIEGAHLLDFTEATA